VNVDVISPKGTKAGSAELPDDLFGIEPNVAVLHQVINAQLAHRRAGTHSTKTRAEVAGGGAKPWRQKGTGRARHGSIRSPQWRGGGIAHGPKPRDYSEKTPKKMVRLALRSALSDRAAEGRVKVLDSWGIDEPKTKAGVDLLVGLGLRPAGERAPRVLIVLDRGEHAVWKSFRNLGERVQIVLPEELNPYDILLNDWIVFSKATLDDTNARYAEKAEAAPAKKAAPAKTAPKAADTSEPDAEGAPADGVPPAAAPKAIEEGDDA
jgi:large subunit ribosomal protein L4